jgi:hypothetical protein
VILLAAAAAIAPLLVHGPSCGHDFDFHLVSWFDALESWRQGIAYPHWTPSANFGAGEPRFVFYSPLTWMLGAALGAALPWPLVPIALTFLLLTLTGLATRALARQMLDEGAATLAGCAALFSGYALFTAYERSAFAEFAGGFWIPLVLLYLLRDGGAFVGAEATPCAKAVPLWRRAFDGSAAPLALAVAGAWLSNPTVGVMACYLLAAVALTRTLLSWSWAPLLRAAAGSLLGMGLIAAYLLPAAWERRWVDILQVTEDPGQTLENSWLFAVHADPGLQPHDEVLRTASIIVVLMTAVALGGALVSWLRGRLSTVREDSRTERLTGADRPIAHRSFLRPIARDWWLPLALIPVVVLSLQFAFSRPLWNLLPELRFLQFPWRWLLVLEAPMAIFFAAAVWPRDAERLWRRVAVAAACAAVFLAMTVCAGSVFFQNCDCKDSVAGMLVTYRNGQGFAGTDEYEPIGSDNSLLPTGLPAACLVVDPMTELGMPTNGPDDVDSPPVWQPEQRSCDATFAAVGNRIEHLRISATIPHSGFLILRLRSYPAWLVSVNGRHISDLPRREDGLIAVPVPNGPVEVTVDWTTTADIILGCRMSFMAALLLTALWLLERRLGRPRLSSERCPSM